MVTARPNIDTRNCTAISTLCPVEATIYGYRPNLAANALLVAIFALFGLLHIGLGIKGKTWFFMGAMICGSVGEALGYAGRIMLWNNVVRSVRHSNIATN